MKVTFVSNYINHHQIPVSNQLAKALGEEYHFIQTEPMEEERIQMGWQDALSDIPYLICFYDQEERCKQLILDSDIVIYGGIEEESYIKPRLQLSKITIRYSERLYKEGQWKAISPRGLRKKYEDHTRYRKQKVYLLCAGGYVASDYHIVKSYPDKMFKWGYFPELKTYSLPELFDKKKKEIPELLWAGRFIDWKHPEYAIQIAQKLKQDKIPFHLSIIGGGELESEIKKKIKNLELEDQISLLGYLSPLEVRERMEVADVFLFTSDYKEGWGVVLNEAMNSGCAVVANHGIGAVPYLLKHRENGFVYENGSLEDCYQKVKLLLWNQKLRCRLGTQAYKTIQSLWNPEVAASRLIDLCSHLLKQQEDQLFLWESGPLSQAEVVSPGKMYQKLTKVKK